MVEITAEHNGLVATHNVTVEAGVPTSIEITRLTMGVLEPTSLTADVLDGRGNRMPGPATMVWDIDGVYAGLENQHGRQKSSGRFMLGFASINLRPEQPSPSLPVHRMRSCLTSLCWFEPEPSKPSRLPRGHQRLRNAALRRGVLGLVCRKRVFNAQGEYLATNTGRWLITVSSGNITGSATLQVIPGDAVASSLMVADAPTTYMAGESYELVYERRDANGYIGFVSPPIHSLTASSGGLSVDDEQRVYWNPSGTGPATLTGMDGTVSTMLELNVEGRTSD